MHDGPPALDPQTRARVVAKARRAIGPDVHRVLVAQNARLAPSPVRDTHIAALASGAAAVVTGQQVGLFLGPLYTLYKAASAVVVARALAAETGIPVVPVFWLQTEDHDLVEIASCEVASGTTTTVVAVPVDEMNRVSIAHLKLPDAVEGCLATLAELLGSGPQALAHLERLRRHYRPGHGWSEAFAGVLGELFAPEGLVVIDPREPALAAAVAPIHARAIEDATRIADALVARSNELGDAAPVHVRPGAPLSFFHPEGAHGPRERIESDLNARLAALAADPMACSTSALLRPIVQDTLLPTAAYIGGPAEVAYFKQLPPLYRAYEMAMPLVIERGHFRIVDERARRRLARIGVSACDLERRSETEVLSRLGRPRIDDAASRLLGPFMAAHDHLTAELGCMALPASTANRASTADTANTASTANSANTASTANPANVENTAHPANPAVTRALAKTRRSVERSVRRFAAKLQRISAYEDAELVDAVRRARAWLAPDGELQERRLGLPCFAARLGDRYVVERVLAAASPFDPTVQELS